MCGVAGLVSRTPIPHWLPAATLRRLRHRGPDGSGSKTLPVGPAHVWLGHTRLSILDLSSAGRQPMRSRDGRWWVSYNGEIYNHLELRKKLRVAWRGRSDTETLVESLAAEGIDATLPRLNGIFAFAALDTVAGKLYLARDPFGVKPMYYAAAKEGGLAFCSELRGLRELAPPGGGVSPQALRAFLTLRFVPSPNTLVQGIRRLPPGHVLVHEPGASCETLHCYIRPPQERFSGTVADAIEAYSTLLARAVARQLLSDVPVGVFLSGGVDSGLVAALAVERAGRLPSYTVGFGAEHEACELAEAAATAALLGLEHHPVRVTPEELWNAFEACVSAVEEPLGTPSILPMWFLAQRARADVTVVLTGQGSDEPWGGYRRYQGALWRERMPFPQLLGALEPLWRALPLPEFVERGLASMPLADRAQRFAQLYSLFPARIRAGLTGDADPGCAVGSIRYWLGWLGQTDASDVRAMMAIDTRLGLADNLLLYGDKISMAHSLEARVPMLDLELVQFVESLPVAYRVSLLDAKIVHKRAAQRRLPAAIVRRRKKSFLVPFSAWSRTVWKDRVAAILLEGDSPLDRRALERLWYEHRSGRRDWGNPLFALISLRLWQRHANLA